MIVYQRVSHRTPTIRPNRDPGWSRRISRQHAIDPQLGAPACVRGGHASVRDWVGMTLHAQAHAQNENADQLFFDDPRSVA